MADIAQYTFKLNDQFSVQLKTIITNISALNKKFNSLNSKINSFGSLAGKSLGKINSGLINTNQSASRFGNNISSSLNKVTRESSRVKNNLSQIGDKGVSSLKKLENQTNATSSGFVGLGRRILGAISIIQGFRLGKQMVTLASDIEQATIKFEVLSGSVEKGQKLIGQLKDFAIKSPFDTASLAKAGATMLNFGVNIDDVFENLKVLGEVSGGNRERFQSLALAFSQSAAAGKLMGQDLLQMVNAGFSPLMEISRRTGESITELRKRMEKGGIAFSEVQQAFKDATEEGGRFNGLLERIRGTFGGQMAELRGSIQILGEEIGTALIPHIQKITIKIQQLTSFILKNKQNIQVWVNSVIRSVKHFGLFIIGFKTASIAIGLFSRGLIALKTGLTILRGGLAAANISLKAFKISLASTGVGLLVVGIGLLVEKLMIWRDNTERQRIAQEKLNKTIKKSNDLLDLESYKQFINSPVFKEIQEGFSVGFKATPTEQFQKQSEAFQKIAKKIKEIEPEELTNFEQFFTNQIISLERKLKGKKVVLPKIIQPDLLGIDQLNKLKLDQFKGFLGFIKKELKSIEDIRNKLGKSTSKVDVKTELTGIDTGTRQVINKVAGAAPRTINITIEAINNTFDVVADNIEEFKNEIEEAVSSVMLKAIGKSVNSFAG